MEKCFLSGFDETNQLMKWVVISCLADSVLYDCGMCGHSLFFFSILPTVTIESDGPIIISLAIN